MPAAQARLVAFTHYNVHVREVLCVAQTLRQAQNLGMHIV
jgi:hypothetical protein